MGHTSEMIDQIDSIEKFEIARLRQPTSSVLALLIAFASFSGSARADGTFLQFDLADDARSAVLSVERDPFTFGAAYNDYDGGKSYGVSANYRLSATTEGAPLNLKLGPSFGVVKDDGAPAETQAGLRMVADKYVSTDFGGLYFLAEVNTIDRAWFLLGKAILAEPKLAVELSRGASDTYSETTLAASRRIGDGPVSLRVGYRFEDEAFFAGISINTF